MWGFDKKKDIKAESTSQIEAKFQTLVQRIEMLEGRCDTLNTSIRRLRSQFNQAFEGEDPEQEEKEKVRPKEKKEEDGFGIFRI